MIKIQIGICTNKYEERLEIGKKYLLYPSKNSGTMTAYVDENTAIPISQTAFVTASVPYHQMFFDIVEEFEVVNQKELKEIKKIEIKKLEEQIESLKKLLFEIKKK